MIDGRFITTPRGVRMARIVLRKPDGVTTYHGRSCALPSDDALWRILGRVADHQFDEPTHGTGCICMDEFVREIKAHIMRIRHETIQIVPEDQVQDMDWKVTSRMTYVLNLATRNLP